MASDRVRYALHVMLNTGAVTPIAWNSKWHGRVSKKNLLKWVETFEASTKPGGLNSHLGERSVLWASLEDTFVDAILHTYGDTPLCPFCKTRDRRGGHRTCGAGECMSAHLAAAHAYLVAAKAAKEGGAA